jgi:hypothetical protein
MRMPGYWVSRTEEGVSLTKTVFDETDLDPATHWREAYQNQDPDVPVRGYVSIEAALACARQLLPEVESATEIDVRQLPLFDDEVLAFRTKQEVDLFAPLVRQEASA